MKCKKCSLPIFYQHQDPAVVKKCPIKFILPGALTIKGDGKSSVYDQVKAKRQDRVSKYHLGGLFGYLFYPSY